MMLSILLLCRIFWLPRRVQSLVRLPSSPRRRGWTTRTRRSQPHGTTPSHNLALYAQPAWQAGDVQGDFDSLQQAIAKSQAATKLAQTRRRACLDYMAEQRLPLAPHVWRRVASTTLATLGFCFLRRNTPSGAVPRTIGRLFQGQFWLLLVLPPLVLVCAARTAAGGESPTGADETAPPTAAAISATTTWSDPMAEDPGVGLVLPLAEQWLAAVLGYGVCAPFLPNSGAWRNGARLLVRLAVPVSVRLYEKLWFQLQEPAARPLSRFLWVLQTLTAGGWLTPLAVAWELSALVPTWSARTLCLVAGGLGASAGSLRWLPRTSGGACRLPVQALLSIVVGATGTQWLWRQRRWSSHVAELLGHRNFPLPSLPALVQTYGRPTLSVVAALLAVAAPLALIVVRLRQLRIVHTHNLSLGRAWDDVGARPMPPPSSSSTNNINMATTTSTTSSHQWRYRYEWVEPRRIGSLLQGWRKKLGYYLFLSGSVDEKLRKDASQRQSGYIKERGLHILQRIDRDLEHRPEAFALGRDEWKQRAMEKMAEQHSKHYDLKTFEDPLGIIVNQVLGVGLGFSFDHESDLPAGVEPSTRRLQARAAKSAIQRSQEIYNATSVRALLETIEDPVERDQTKARLRQDAEAEIQHLAKRLTELIPTDMNLDSPTTRYVVPDFKKKSNNEYVASEPLDYSPSLERLRAVSQMEIDDASAASLSQPVVDEAAPSTSDDLDHGDDLTVQKDDEFVEAWEKRHLASNNSPEEDDTVLC